MALRLCCDGVGEASVQHDEVQATLSMLAAHASLRLGNVVDPDSLSNREMLERMVRNALLDTPSLPAPLEDVVLPAEGTLVGTLPGAFSVNSRGNAIYRMKLRMPDTHPRLGFSPDISYQSQLGDGLLGRRFWFSTNLPRDIVRGRSLLSRHGEIRGLEGSASDRFYFDSKLMVCVTGPETYGRPDSVYRTEVDSFKRIVAKGSGESIDTFVVYEPDGRRLIFGKFEDSEDGFQRTYDEERERLGDVAHVYALKRVEDPLGNYLEFHYTHKGFGDWVLSRIDFNGRRDHAPLYAMHFHYRQRHAASAYRVLERSDDRQLLELIQICEAPDGDVVTEYHLDYERPDPSGVHQLNSITGYFRADRGRPLEALPPTRFTWSKGIPEDAVFPSFELPPPDHSEGGNSRNIGLLGDFNGDGATDYLIFNQAIHVALSDRNGFGTVFQEWLTEDTIREMLAGSDALGIGLGDFDGNGIDDVILAGADGRLAVFRSTGERFEPLARLDLSDLIQATESTDVKVPPAAGWISRMVTGDLSGDGRTDVLVHGPDGRLHQFIWNGSAFERFSEAAATVPTAGPVYRTALMDLNYNGLHDYLWVEAFSEGDRMEGTEHSATGLRLRYRLNLPEGGFSPAVTIHQWNQDTTGGAGIALLSGFFNGDSFPDFLVGEPSDRVEGELNWITLLSRRHPPHLRHPEQPTYTKVTVSPTGGPSDASLSAGAIDLRLEAEQKYRGLQRDGTAMMLISPGIEIDPGLNLFALDLNHDRWDDFIWFERKSDGSGSWWSRTSLGDGNFAPPQKLDGHPWRALQAPDSGSSRNRMLVRRNHDINGDGISDWTVEQQSVRGTYLAGSFNGTVAEEPSSAFGNLVTHITNGLGSTLTVGYRGSRDPSVYSQGAPVLYPIREVKGSIPLVAEYGKDYGGTPYHFSYRWGARRIDLSARGLLGFGSMITFDRQTGFFKFQHLSQSFPMTGLSVRERTYKSQLRDGYYRIELITMKDIEVVFDAVADPVSGALYGTLYPFVASEVESRWASGSNTPTFLPTDDSLDQMSAHLLFPSPVLPRLSAPVTTQYWYDEQNLTQRAGFGLPNYRTVFITREDQLKGTVRHGNQTLKRVVQANGNFRDEIRTFYPPEGPEDPFTRLEATLQIVERTGTTLMRGPVTTSRYFCNTTLLDSVTVDSHSATEAGSKGIRTTTYERDEWGREVRRRELTQPERGNDADASSGIVYVADDFDEWVGLPQRIWEGQWYREICYHPYLRTPVKTIYANAETVVRDFDALGRVIRIENSATGFVQTIDYAWTRPENDCWRQTQRVDPPAGGQGMQGISVYATRNVKSTEPTVISYYDRMNRVIRTIKRGDDAPDRYIDYVFDNEGRKAADSQPYAPGETIIWTVFYYDSDGNVSNSVRRRQEPKL